jgi:hypothetical protein
VSFVGAPFPANVDLALQLVMNDGYGAFPPEGISGAENLVGSAGHDILRGDALGNRLGGGGGDDILRGRDGGDVLLGRDDDILDGGWGSDILTGGAGADRFLFAGAADSAAGPLTRDRIADFSALQDDRVDLAEIDANGVAADGNQNFVLVAGEVQRRRRGGADRGGGGMDPGAGGSRRRPTGRRLDPGREPARRERRRPSALSTGTGRFAATPDHSPSPNRSRTSVPMASRQASASSPRAVTVIRVP